MQVVVDVRSITMLDPSRIYARGTARMLRGFILWLAGGLVLLVVWISQEGNVGWLMWIMLAWWVAGVAWEFVRARKSRSVDAGPRSAPMTLQQGNQFDPESCGRILRIAAICFVALVVLEFIFFLTVKSAKCPGWQTPMENESGVVWMILLFATFWALHISYRAVTWRRFSRKILDQIEWGRRTYVPGTNPTWLSDWTQFNAMCAVKNNMNTIIIVVLVLSAIFVASPVLTRIGCL
jgi:hypothetical protein